jgi:hypothetical protein
MMAAVNWAPLLAVLPNTVLPPLIALSCLSAKRVSKHRFQEVRAAQPATGTGSALAGFQRRQSCANGFEINIWRIYRTHSLTLLDFMSFFGVHEKNCCQVVPPFFCFQYLVLLDLTRISFSLFFRHPSKQRITPTATFGSRHACILACPYVHEEISCQINPKTR